MKKRRWIFSIRFGLNGFKIHAAKKSGKLFIALKVRQQIIDQLELITGIAGIDRKSVV